MPQSDLSSLIIIKDAPIFSFSDSDCSNKPNIVYRILAFFSDSSCISAKKKFCCEVYSLFQIFYLSFSIFFHLIRVCTILRNFESSSFTFLLYHNACEANIKTSTNTQIFPVLMFIRLAESSYSNTQCHIVIFSFSTTFLKVFLQLLHR